MEPPENKRRILIAPACFKGTLSAMGVAEVLRDLLAAHLPAETVLDVCPVADGGDDTLDVLLQSDPGFREACADVTGPVPGQRVTARYLVHADKKLAVLESAQAHGYKLLPGGHLAPMAATSYGVGELLRTVLARAESRGASLEAIVVTVGGSASTDGGLGALQALGVGFWDAAGHAITEPIAGESLARIHRIEWVPDWTFPGQILIATDVINPLLGLEGAASVFAPQKGATPKQCAELEAGLQHASTLMTALCGVSYATLPGAGAAGGLAWGLRHLPRSGFISGSQWIADQLDLERRIAQANLIITGEGRLDATSLSGKATGHVLVWAAGKPVLVFCGQAEARLALPGNIHVMPLVLPGEDAGEAMANPRVALEKRLFEALPVIRACLKL
ncbi:MAG TPA: glycerate kinase [Coleofasciculaceae cyanobacterium]|jgi:glycerate kinase